MIFTLEKKLSELGYQSNSKTEVLDVDYFIKILNFIFVEAIKPFYQYLIENQFPLYSMSDYDFIQALLKIHLKIFNKPSEISQSQFFQQGFVDKKIEFCLQSLEEVRSWSLSRGISLKLERGKQSKKIPKPPVEP